MALRLKGSSSGYAEIDASADAGSVTLTLPATAGTINVKDASGNTNVGTGVNLGNPGPNIFTINTNGSERFRIAADGGVSIPGVLTYEDVTSVDAIGLSTFREGLNTKDVGITTITSSDINGATAVDVFVYDTSKDSDGGAWRKRTSHTSWYNETLGTATRGTRKEFPAVAVIVLESTKVTIYDGDDPDLPMWMVLNRSASSGWTPNNTNILGVSYSTFTSISMLNGIFAMGADYADDNNNGVLIKVSFVEDTGYFHGVKSVNSSYPAGGFGRYRGSIAERDSAKGHININDTDKIVNVHVNDVAMTVLPNAPIDDATGLPISTIAVATDGGMSVIKDDGSVISTVSSSHAILKVDFTDDYGLNAVVSNGSNGNYGGVYVNDFESIKGLTYQTYANWDAVVYQYKYGNKVLTYKASGINDAPCDFIDLKNRSSAIGIEASGGGLTLLEKSPKDAFDPDGGMVAFATTSFNTGWMHGDVKGAFVSDTDTTNVSSSNLISGATYNNSDRITSYSYTNGSSTLVITDNPATADGYVTLTLGGLTPLTTYVLTVTANQTYTPTVGYNIHVGTTVDGTVYCDDDFTGTANQSITFKTASSGDPTLVLYSNYNGALTYTLDLRLAEFDRSVGTLSAWNAGQSARIGQKNGLAVFGTITKSAVATGAELVSYSGWSASNNLVQPYNSNLNFGTGDFCFTTWIKKTTLSTNHYVLDRNDGSSETDRFSFMINAAGKLNLYSGSTNAQSESAAIFAGSSAWRMVMVKRVGGVITFGLDGKEYVSTASVAGWDTTNITGSGNENLFIGQYGGGGVPGNVAYNVDYGIGEIANLRLSASAPSSEQFKKMYEDEKHLYQENAKCTLHGSSDAVTALGYDETTDQLHVGTSGGRSDFQGLRRINNTTTAVETAISAHDTFIIEQ